MLLWLPAPMISGHLAQSGALRRSSLVAGRGSLPANLSRFVGRQHEIQQVSGLLSEECLVTLTGPGGIGKTRLAVATAGAVLSTYEDGVWFVDLSRVSDPGLVVPALASTFNVRGQPNVGLLDSLIDELQDQ